MSLIPRQAATNEPAKSTIEPGFRTNEPAFSTNEPGRRPPNPAAGKLLPDNVFPELPARPERAPGAQKPIMPNEPGTGLTAASASDNIPIIDT
ncbi:MAG: hypothetical protein R3D28_19380 [Geminicoccaceae bacterium]